ncbi:MAG TPA: type I-E CRISPR-associated endoribonuclease Cas2 [Firmicutes bacterium]|nr:type I-E CRISPR-associated endoribonuclease Cas2 [Bacillota bacterium]
MVVIILERVPKSLRGELSKWLIEPKAGVFIGNVNARVRDKLWEMCCKRLKRGGIIQAWNTNNEQRMDIRSYGIDDREIVDMEGLKLVRLTK